MLDGALEARPGLSCGDVAHLLDIGIGWVEPQKSTGSCKAEGSLNCSQGASQLFFRIETRNDARGSVLCSYSEVDDAQ